MPRRGKFRLSIIAPRRESPLHPVESSLSDNRLALAILICGCVALCALFWPFAEGRLFLYYDLGNYHLPVRAFYSAALHNGFSPNWIPNLFSGFYLHGEGQVGIYHPLHWLAYRAFHLRTAFMLECLIAYPLAGIGMALFLRRLRLPNSAVAMGALLFALSGYTLLRLTHLNVVAILAHTPWLLWLIDCSVREVRPARREGARLGIALLTGSQILLGYPGAVVLSGLIEGLYVLHLSRQGRVFAPLLWLVGAKLLGALIGCIQLLPTYEAFTLSVRSGAPLEYRMAGSLHPWNLLQLLSPYLFSNRVYNPSTPNPVEEVFYFGSIMPVAIAWLIVRRKQLEAWQPLLLGLLVIGLVAIPLSLGTYGGVSPILSSIPLVGQLRVPARFSFIVQFAMVIAAAIAFADLAAARREDANRMAGQTRWLLAVPAASAVATGIALALGRLPSLVHFGDSLAEPALAFAGSALALGCVALFTRAAKGDRLALIGLAVFAAADISYFCGSLWWTDPPQEYAEFPARIPRPPAVFPERTAIGYTYSAVADEDGSYDYYTSTRFILHDARLVSGYVGLPPARYLDPWEPDAMRLAAATTFLVGDEFWPLADPLPLIRLVSEAIVSTDPASAIEMIPIARTAVVDRPLGLGGGTPGEVEVGEYMPGSITVRTATATRQLLVIAESHHPGWKLQIDGEKAPLIRAYGDFMGVVVESGEHEVRLVFDPDSLRNGTSITLTALGGLLVFAMASGLRRAWSAPGSGEGLPEDRAFKLGS
jgi:hypothetical protein